LKQDVLQLRRDATDHSRVKQANALVGDAHMNRQIIAREVW
jgi:hypothetical protein